MVDPVTRLRSQIRAYFSLVSVCFLTACNLLNPYPNGGSAEDQFIKASDGERNGVQNGNDPLIDPVIDNSVAVVNRKENPAIAFAGSAFNIELAYQANNMNVVGGGIRLPGDDKVQWTFVNGLHGTSVGDIRFAYVVGINACEEIPTMCHEIVTEQFAVTQNIQTGEYEVSPPVEVSVVLQCASCQSKSCTKLLEKGQCKACPQPQACIDLYNACFAPGAKKHGSTEADIFSVFMGPSGSLWGSAETCVEGEVTCQAVLEKGIDMEDSCEF